MAGRVTLRHPGLPPEQTITVADSAVPHHRASGWEPVADPPPADVPAAEPAVPAVTGDTTEPSEAPRRRSSKPKED